VLNPMADLDTRSPLLYSSIGIFQIRQVILLAYVEVNANESVESALRRFKRKVQQEAIIKEIKKHSVYLKPGEKRRLKLAQAKKRMRKRLKREMTDF